MLHFSEMTFGVNTMTWGIVPFAPLNYGPGDRVPLKDFTKFAVNNEEDALWKVRLAIGVIVGIVYKPDSESPNGLMPLVRKWNVLARTRKQAMTYARKE